MQADEGNRLTLLLTGFEPPAHSSPISLDKPERRDYKRCSKTQKQQNRGQYLLGLDSHFMKLGRWSDHFVVFTGEYTGGILAGTGLGILIAKALLAPPDHPVVFAPLIWLLGCCCMAVGSSLARAAQRRRFRKDLDDDKHEA